MLCYPHASVRLMTFDVLCWPWPVGVIVAANRTGLLWTNQPTDWYIRHIVGGWQQGCEKVKPLSLSVSLSGNRIMYAAAADCIVLSSVIEITKTGLANQATDSQNGSVSPPPSHQPVTTDSPPLPLYLSSFCATISFNGSISIDISYKMLAGFKSPLSCRQYWICSGLHHQQDKGFEIRQRYQARRLLLLIYILQFSSTTKKKRIETSSTVILFYFFSYIILPLENTSSLTYNITDSKFK